MARPMAAFLDSLGGYRVTVTVGDGDEAKSWRLPQNLLCSRSAWFRNALQHGEGDEEQHKEIDVPDDLPSVFEEFLYFVYRETLIYTEWPTKPAEFGRELIRACRLWTFGEKYQLPELQNCVMYWMCGLLGKSRAGIKMADIEAAFEVTSDNSPVREILGDYLDLKLGRKLPSDDFPRYYKPKRHQALLWQADEAEVPLYIQAGWNMAVRSCEECGFGVEDGQGRCRRCMLAVCTCEKGTWMLFCERCEASHAWRRQHYGTLTDFDGSGRRSRERSKKLALPLVARACV